MTPRDGYILVTEDRRSAEIAGLLWRRVRADRGASAPTLVSNPGAPLRSPEYFKPPEALTQAKERKLPIMGKLHRSLESLRGLEPQVRAASLLARALDADVALFVVDDDRVEGCSAEVKEAARNAPAARVAAGVALPEVEAWLITQATGTEQTAMRNALGFDPTREPRRMSSTSGARARDAKSVLDEYVDEGEARAALESQPLHALRATGGPSGLSAFLDALDAACL